MILIPLYAALLVAGTFIKIPIPPVPITLQTLIVFICALTLDTKSSLSSVLLYIFLGVVGLPVFSSGGGMGAFTGPTAGYIWGMVPAVIIGSMLSHDKTKLSVKRNIPPCVLMEVAIYIPGLLWLSHSRELGLGPTLSAGLAPFIVGDIIKIAVASVIASPIASETEKIKARSVAR